MTGHIDPCPSCPDGSVCKTFSCGRLRERNLKSEREAFLFYQTRLDLYAQVWARSAHSALERLKADDPCWLEEGLVTSVRFIPEEAEMVARFGPVEGW